ncbi:hypothetical protein GE061_002738 [Apolygus lucorum]|uniref:Uncharacterized protein n=1 Tax=Apolygus lucorum TaxID=248454 RepID=A0A8S9X5Y3_APOLU|nr:hypothetical protein GE061_002738 [Apolygus lucorum]
MEEEILVNEEATEDEVKEEVEIKQVVVMGDEDVEIKQEVVMGNEDVEEVEIKQEMVMGDEDVEEVEIKQEMVMGDEDVEEVEIKQEMVMGDEDVEEVEIKQEVVMGDEDVEEEVGNRWAVEDEVEGYLMIKREDGLTDPLGEESDVLEGSSGVQRNIMLDPTSRKVCGGQVLLQSCRREEVEVRVKPEVNLQ